MLIFVAVMIPVTIGNLLVVPERPFFLLLLMGWFSALAVHVAFVMGLFDKK